MLSAPESQAETERRLAPNSFFSNTQIDEYLQSIAQKCQLPGVDCVPVLEQFHKRILQMKHEMDSLEELECWISRQSYEETAAVLDLEEETTITEPCVIQRNKWLTPWDFIRRSIYARVQHADMSKNIYFPYCLEKHYVLFVVNRQRKTLSCFDSLGVYNNCKSVFQALQWIFSLFFQVSLSTSKVIVRHQYNLVDCGPFICIYAMLKELGWDDKTISDMVPSTSGLRMRRRLLDIFGIPGERAHFSQRVDTDVTNLPWNQVIDNSALVLMHRAQRFEEELELSLAIALSLGWPMESKCGAVTKRRMEDESTECTKKRRITLM